MGSCHSKELIAALEQNMLCKAELPSLIFRIVALEAPVGADCEYVKEKCEYIRQLVDEILRSTEDLYSKISKKQ